MFQGKPGQGKFCLYNSHMNYSRSTSGLCGEKLVANRIIGRGVNLTTHLYTMPRLRTEGAIGLFRHIPSWRAQGQVINFSPSRLLNVPQNTPSWFTHPNDIWWRVQILTSSWAIVSAVPGLSVSVSAAGNRLPHSTSVRSPWRSLWRIVWSNSCQPACPNTPWQ